MWGGGVAEGYGKRHDRRTNARTLFRTNARPTLHHFIVICSQIVTCQGNHNNSQHGLHKTNNMPKLKLTLQQVRENYAREVAQRTKLRIDGLTSTTNSRQNREDLNYAEMEVLPCEIQDAIYNMNKKMNVMMCIVALLVVYLCAMPIHLAFPHAT